MEILFNNFRIKKISSLIHFLSKTDGDIVISGDLNFIFNLFDITDNKITPDELIDVILNNRKSIRSIVKYISNNKTNIEIDRLNKFIEHKINNPYDANSELSLKLMYGEEKGLKLFKQQQTKFSKYYDVNYYVSLGMTLIEAENKIKEFKDNKSTKLSNFVKKYGDINGTIKYNEYVDKSKNTIDNFKKRYGDDWEKKWENYTLKDSSSFNWALKKSKGDLFMAEKLFNEKIKKTTINLDFLIKKYGENDGKLIFNELNKKKDASSLDYFVKKYGDYDIALSKYKENNKKKDCSSFDYFKEKYGDDANQKYLEKCDSSDCRSLNYFKEKYGDDEMAKKMYFETNEMACVKLSKASRESLKYFKPLYDYLINNNVTKKEDLYLGVDESGEYFIRHNLDLFFYDFTIKSKKIIIEFNGKAWHPNWEKYGITECIEKFKNKNINPVDAINKDIFKINLAKKMGFSVLVLWEEDGLNKNLNKLKLFLKEKQINYEN
jgi:hypothetical protein